MIVACEAGKSMQKKDLLPIEDVREKNTILNMEISRSKVCIV